MKTTFATAMKNTLDDAARHYREVTTTHRLQMMNCASECDRLATQLAADMRHMAERMTLEAVRIEADPLGVRSDPTGYSTLRDITINGAKFECAKREMFGLVRAVFGKIYFDLLEELIVEEARQEQEAAAQEAAAKKEEG